MKRIKSRMIEKDSISKSNPIPHVEQKTCLFDGCEDKGFCQLKTAVFEPIKEFEKVLSDINKLYTGHRGSTKLFSYRRYENKIVLTADTYLLSFCEFDQIREDDEIKKYLVGLGISKCTANILTEMIYFEDNAVGSIVEKITKPNQTFKVQLTDTIYGNSEFEIES